jgi:proline iminopeptidase
MIHPHTVTTDEVDLACTILGDGPPLLFINGGPGDTHRYLLPVAERMADRFRCILYDQRGCGASRLDRLDDATLHVQRFVADIEAIRCDLGYDRLNVFGHSWGAMLALIHAAVHPDSVERQVLVGLGPLDAAQSAVARANLLRPLDPAERAALAALKQARKDALEADDLANHAEMHIRQMREFSARGWFHKPEAAAAFAEAFAAGYDCNPRITPHVWPSVMAMDIFGQIEGLTVPTLVVYGCQDFEPITQAYLLRERMPRAEVCLINECGHVPWLEQPEAFYEAVASFLQRD